MGSYLCLPNKTTSSKSATLKLTMRSLHPKKSTMNAFKGTDTLQGSTKTVQKSFQWEWPSYKRVLWSFQHTCTIKDHINLIIQNYEITCRFFDQILVEGCRQWLKLCFRKNLPVEKAAEIFILNYDPTKIKSSTSKTSL